MAKTVKLLAKTLNYGQNSKIIDQNTKLILGLSLPTYPSFYLFAASSVSSGFFFLRPPWTFHSLSCVGLPEVWAGYSIPSILQPDRLLGGRAGELPPKTRPKGRHDLPPKPTHKLGGATSGPTYSPSHHCLLSSFS